jgi:hypothetical protein
VPAISIRLIDKKMQVRTPRIQAIVDSGSSVCLFDASLLTPFKIKLESGVKSEIGGIGGTVPVYYHEARILVGADWRIEVNAGFIENLSCGAILGRLGFFTAFKVLFDHSTDPPELEISKIEPLIVH